MNAEQHRGERELLGAYVLGQLDLADAVRLREHLDECAACRAELSDLVPLKAALRSIDPERLEAQRLETPATPEPDLEVRILRVIQQRRRIVDRRRTSRRTLFSLAVAAAVFSLGALIGIPGMPKERTATAPPVEAVAMQALARGVSADAGVVVHTWGTELKLVATGLRQGATYSVTFVRYDGTAVPAGTFLGTGSNPVRCSLNAALPRASASQVFVTDTAGAVILRAQLPA